MTTTLEKPKRSLSVAPLPVEWPREADPALFDFYAETSLEPGVEGPPPWVENGVPSSEDVQGFKTRCRYIAFHLTHSPGLRRQWRVSEVLGRHVLKVTPGMVRRLCAWWACNVPFEDGGPPVAGNGDPSVVNTSP